LSDYEPNRIVFLTHINSNGLGCLHVALSWWLAGWAFILGVVFRDIANFVYLALACICANWKPLD